MCLCTRAVGAEKDGGRDERAVGSGHGDTAAAARDVRVEVDSRHGCCHSWVARELRPPSKWRGRVLYGGAAAPRWFSR